MPLTNVDFIRIACLYGNYEGLRPVHCEAIDRLDALAEDWTTGVPFAANPLTDPAATIGSLNATGFIAAIRGVQLGDAVGIDTLKSIAVTLDARSPSPGTPPVCEQVVGGSTGLNSLQVQALIDESDFFILRGTLGAGTTVLPAADRGNVFRISAPLTLGGQTLSPGDMILATSDNTPAGSLFAGNWEILGSTSGAPGSVSQLFFTVNNPLNTTGVVGDQAVSYTAGTNTIATWNKTGATVWTPAWSAALGGSSETTRYLTAAPGPGDGNDGDIALVDLTGVGNVTVYEKIGGAWQARVQLSERTTHVLAANPTGPDGQMGDFAISNDAGTLRGWQKTAPSAWTEVFNIPPAGGSLWTAAASSNGVSARIKYKGSSAPSFSFDDSSRTITLTIPTGVEIEKVVAQVPASVNDAASVWTLVYGANGWAANNVSDWSTVFPPDTYVIDRVAQNRAATGLFVSTSDYSRVSITNILANRDVVLVFSF